MGSWKKIGRFRYSKYKDEEGTYPESVAIYWMTTDIMWADGEGMAQLLYLLGVEPVWLSNGKVKHFKIIDLNDLGRPRIDITVKISGILRDNFQNCVCFLDDAIQAVSKLKEPLELNFVRVNMPRKSAISTGSLAGMMRPRILEHSRNLHSSGINFTESTLRHGKIKMTLLILFMNFNSYSMEETAFGKQSPFALESSFNMLTLLVTKLCR